MQSDSDESEKDQESELLGKDEEQGLRKTSGNVESQARESQPNESDQVRRSPGMAQAILRLCCLVENIQGMIKYAVGAWRKAISSVAASDEMEVLAHFGS